LPERLLHSQLQKEDNTRMTRTCDHKSKKAGSQKNFLMSPVIQYR
jgi:hypothetical protein